MKLRITAVFLAVLCLSTAFPAVVAADDDIDACAGTPGLPDITDFRIGVGGSITFDYDQGVNTIKTKTQLADHSALEVECFQGKRQNHDFLGDHLVFCDSSKPGFKVKSKRIGRHHTDLTVKCFTQR